MKCLKCQFDNPEGMKCCGECGAKLEKVCPKCNFSNPPQFKFCGECGHNLSFPSEAKSEELSFDEKLAKIQRYLPEGITEKAVYRGLMMRTLFIIGILMTLSSCTHIYQFTYTKKSGIEQLLVTKAVQEAIQMMTVDMKGSKVFVDVACLMRDEQSYIRKAFTHWFLGAGVFISEYPWDADYIVSVLVKVAGTDGDQLSLGVPSVPIPLTIGITTPALTLLSQMNQEGRVEMEVVIYSTKGGIKEKIPSLTGNSYYKKYVIFFIPFTRKNIP